jgi:murein DD-endopeptidase MepM/ murein hydrolase activator NlpD
VTGSVWGVPRRKASLAAVLALLLSFPIPASADLSDKLQENAQRSEVLRARIGRLEGKSQALSHKVSAADNLVASAQAEVDALDSQLAKLSHKIDEVQRDLTEAQKRMALLTRRLQEILKKLDQRVDVFTDRAVAAYMAGPTAYVDGMLSSENFRELIDRFAYYESALETDSMLVDEIEYLRDETTARRDLVEEKKEEIAQAKARLVEDRAALAQVRAQRAQILAQRQDALAEKRSLLSDVESTKARYRKVLDQLEADSDRIQAILSAGTSSGTASGSGQLLWPAAGPVTSGFGYRTHPIFGDRRLHTGIDIGAPYGAPVFASDSGVVVFAGVMSGYGNAVVVDHGGGLATTYNHLSSFSVGNGSSVGRGQNIAAVGCTGYCTGTHLHFEVRVNGNPVDPMPYLR